MKDGVLYAIALGAPKKELLIKSLGKAAKLLDQPIRDVKLLAEKRNWSGSRTRMDWSSNPSARGLRVGGRLCHPHEKVNPARLVKLSCAASASRRKILHETCSRDH